MSRAVRSLRQHFEGPILLVLALLIAFAAPLAAQDSILLSDDGDAALVLGSRASSEHSQALFAEERDLVSVFTLSGNYDKLLADGSSNLDPRQVIAREFYSRYPDEYDFLIVFTTFEYVTGDVRAFAWVVRNDVQGIGLPLYDQSEGFGSDGRLQTYIDMAALTRWQLDPVHPGFAKTLMVLSHEILHRWGARVRFRDTDGSASTALLGQDGSHWSYLLDSDASVHYGADWRGDGGGQFTAASVLKFWNPLDLYLAGFNGPHEVPPLTLIESPGVDPTQLPRLGATVNGTPRTITVDDIIAAEGPRVPSAAEAQRDFRLAFLLVKREGETVSDAQITAINQLRDRIATHFSALTGGRGRLYPYPQARPDGSPGSPPGVGGGPIRPGTANLEDAFAWLRGRQTVDGYWQDTAATRLRDTVVALDALEGVDPFFVGEDRARTWIGAQPAPSTDYLARAARALVVPNASPETQWNGLLARQNADGGWGVVAGFESDPLDTAVAVLALAERTGHAATAAALDRAAAYLLAAKNADGGWAGFKGGASRTSVSATCLAALAAIERAGPVRTAAIQFLAGRQNPDGGFGDSPSTAHDTALVLATLMAVDGLPAVSGSSAAAFLEARQTLDGSWDGSVYSTALVLSALQRFRFPNLSFSAALEVEPLAPVDGQRVDITARVRNDGVLPVSGAILRLFEGDPASGGVASGPDVTLPPMAPGAAVAVTLPWDSFGHPGSNPLTVVIDPDAAIQELSEIDNQAAITVEVVPASAEADLEVTPTDISISPDHPSTLPADLGISVTVRNLGQSDAPAVLVRLLAGPAESAVVVGEQTVAVPQRSSSPVSFSYTLTSPGETLFTVVVDPDNTLSEPNEGNNTATRAVVTAAALDLSVSAADLELVGSALVGQDAVFRVTLRNLGTVDSPSFTVQHSIFDGTAFVPVQTTTEQINAGGSTTREITWRVDREGALALVVTLDPQGLVPESEEGNNSAQLPFNTGVITQPNLALDFRDLLISPVPGLEGAPLQLSAVVRNNGGSAVSDLEVGFYDGDPAQGGQLIGTLQTVPSLAQGASATVTLTWPRVPTAADRLLFVVADPNQLVSEFREDDNAAFQTLAVLSLPDLVLTPAALALSPPLPAPGEPVTLTVTLSNLGEQGAGNIVLRAFDGDPNLGGVQVGGDQTVAAIAGNGSAIVAFTWIYGAAGERPLVVLADPDNTIEEGNEANNRASIDVISQSGDFFITQRYFSPNGDGVQDGTAVVFRLDAPSDVAIEISDLARAKRVRRVEGEGFNGIEAGRFEWDGRDDLGRLVRDAEYRVRLLTAQGALLHEGLVTLDTNRSSLLQSAGTGYQSLTNLTCELPSVNDFQFSRDEAQYFFSISSNSDPTYRRGIYRAQADGSELGAIVTSSWFGAFSPSQLVVSRDGRKIAFVRFRSSPSRQELWVANSDGTGLVPLDNDGSYFGVLVGFDADGSRLIAADVGGIVAQSINGSPAELLVPVPLNWEDIKLSPAATALTFEHNSETSPERILELYDLVTRQRRELLRITNGGFFPAERLRWAPTGERFAYQTGESRQLILFGRDGQTQRVFDLPTDQGLDENDQPVELDANWANMDWDRAGAELVLAIHYGDACAGIPIYERLGRLDVATGDYTTFARTRAYNNCHSYRVSTWDGTAWVERGALHHDLRYSEHELDLSAWLPDADGEYKLRLRQTGLEAAHVEAISLEVGRSRSLPVSAVRQGDFADVLDLVSAPDGDVLDLHEKSVEVRFEEVPPGAVKLALWAREEQLSGRNAVPFRYPAAEGGFYSVALEAGAAMSVDGEQTAADALGEPLFETISRPDTGHPNAPVLAHVSSDGAYLYAALDFAVDNTIDGERDWAALHVRGTDGWRELRVTAADATHGAVGFTRTGVVGHRHKYYEFRVALAELGLAPGELVDLYFEAYGTAAELPDEDPSLLAIEGKPFWDPNDRAVLWASGEAFVPSSAIFFEEGDRRAPLFEDEGFVSVRGFLPSGRTLQLASSKDANDPASACFRRGFEDEFAFRSLENLTADLRPRRLAGFGGFRIDGTAIDRNFARFELEYSRATPPLDWKPVQPPSDRPVLDERITTWAPPSAGTFFLRLTAIDRAGNRTAMVKRVSSVDAPTITDLSLSPDLFSPNGDGFRESATVSYRVLQPVHLEFNFFNAAGDRVRTVERDHSTIGTVHSFVWDGRDDRGLPLPDGEYSLVVQNFELFAEIDTTAPRLELRVQKASSCGASSSGFPQGLSPGIFLEGVDSNLDETSLLVETGEGADPFRWQIFYPGNVSVDLERDLLTASRALELAELVNHRFRVELADRAGNRSRITSVLAPEELFLLEMGRFGRHPLTGLPLRREPALCGGGTVVGVELGDFVIEAAESVRAPLAELSIEFQPLVRTADGEDYLPPSPDGWFSRPVTSFDPASATIPEGELDVLWDMLGVEAGKRTAVRLAAVDQNGATHRSDYFAVQGGGVTFLGLSAPDFLLAESLRRAAGPDFDPEYEFWAVEQVTPPFASATLFLQSDEDPRYAVPRAFPSAAITNGGFLFGADDLRSCVTYHGWVVAVTEPAIDPLTGLLGPLTYRTTEKRLDFPCLALEFEIAPLRVGECNDHHLSDRRRIALTPTSLDGSQLQLLSLIHLRANGTEQLLATINAPVSDRTYDFEIDTRDLSEGAYGLIYRLSNVNGEVVERRVSTDLVTGAIDDFGNDDRALDVDRTLPSAVEITYPAPGQRVCGLLRDGASVLDLQGRIVDESGIAYGLHIENEDDANAMVPHTGGRLGIDENGDVFERVEIGEPRKRLIVPQHTGVLGTMSGTTGNFRAWLETVDAGGNHVCSEPVPFYFDGIVEPISVDAGLEVFSPNGDLQFDLQPITVTTTEPTTAHVRIVEAFLDSFGLCRVRPTVVRELASGLALFEQASFSWDGRDDGGQVAADDWYAVLSTFSDGCGNVTGEYDCFELDNTPPSLEILYPTPTSPLPVMVEVLGSALDPHLALWGLEFGEGPAPETWSVLAVSDQPKHEEFLGRWNTYSLDGPQTLRIVGRDTVGNRAEVRTTVVITHPTVLIAGLDTLPRPFSPNGDGRREALSIRFDLLTAVEGTLRVLELDGDVVRTLLDAAPLAAGPFVYTWDGLSNGGQPAADGPYRVELYARMASNLAVTQREEVSALLDRTPPLLAFTRPTAGGWLPGTGTFIGTLSDLNMEAWTVELAENPQGPVWQPLANGTTSRVDAPFGNLSELEEGDYALRAWARDAGEIESELVLPFAIDRTPPVVTLTAPPPNSLLRQAAGPIAVSGTVEELHLSSYVLEFGAGAEPSSWTELTRGTTLPAPEPLHAWNAAALVDGRYTLRLTATDLAGNTGTARLTVVLDSTPPLVVIELPAENAFVKGAQVIRGTASDLHFAEYELAVAPGAPGSSTQFSPIHLGAVQVTNGQLALWQLLPPDGTYTLRLTASDRAGNSASTLRAVRVDTHPPAAALDLAARLENRRDAHLAWTANSEPDLAGYLLFRDGTRITPTPITATTYVDANLAEGLHVYWVLAVDEAGNESQRSNTAEVRVDLSPPIADIVNPANGAVVSGLVDIRGTAHSNDDFAEYRLFAVSAAGTSQLLRRSPVPLIADVLAQWSTLELPEGAVFTLRLEAEDLEGNVAVDSVQVTVDNLPPAPPTGLAAAVSVANINVSWNANTEPDLAGYLLYRDGRLVNATGPVVGSLAPYILTATTYADLNRPDGTYVYEVYAIDRAGNISGPSGPASATVERRAPRAVIVTPASGHRFESDLFIQATSEDTDVARVQFQYRPNGTTTWINLNAADTAAPWETIWSDSVPLGIYQLRAVATDSGNRTDSAPPSINVERADLTRPDPVLDLTARVDGGDVTLTWPAVAVPDLAGYHVDRHQADGFVVRVTSSPVSTTQYIDPGLADGLYGYTVVAVDGAGNASDPSPLRQARVYTPLLEQPYTPSAATVAALAGSGEAAAQVNARVMLAGVSTPLGTTTSDAEGRFSFAGISLGRGENTLAVRLTDALGNRSKEASVVVVSDEPPSAPTGVVATVVAGLDVDLTWNVNPEADILGYRVLRDGAPRPPLAVVTGLAATASNVFDPANAVDGDPHSWWYGFNEEGGVGEWLAVSWPSRVLLARVELDWQNFGAASGNRWYPTDYDFEAWDGRAWVRVLAVRGELAERPVFDLPVFYRTDRLRLVLRAPSEAPLLSELRVFHLPLTTPPAFHDDAGDGVFSYRVVAVDTHGLESAPSAPVTAEVGDIVPPEPVVLTATVSGADVRLDWTASTSPDVVSYDLYRDGAKIVETPTLTHLDAGRPNGTCVYIVRAVDAAGNSSAPSNEATAVVALPVPQPPVLLAVDPLPAGGALNVRWQPAAGSTPAAFRLLRATVSGGPYAEVAVTTALERLDGGLVNGQRYFYVVESLDALGNSSPRSNEGSGVPLDTLAPAAPVLHHPAFAGRPARTTEATAHLYGTAEAASQVTVSRQGGVIAQVDAAATLELHPLPFDTYPPAALSPDGARLLRPNFSGSDVLDLATGSSLSLEGVFTPVSWLPDGERLLYSAGGALGIYRVADGSSSTVGDFTFVYGVAPSLDGRAAVIGERGGLGGLWIVDLATGAATLVVEASPFDFDGSSLVFSPRGDAVAYRVESPALGIELVRLPAGAVSVVESQPGSGHPRFSPDGGTLLYTSFAGGSEEARLYRLADNTSAPFTLPATLPPGELRGAEWTADGRSLLLFVDGVGLVRQRVAGGEAELLLANEGPSFTVLLEGAASGHVALAVDGTGFRLGLPGRFELPAAALAAGTNTFTAVSNDAAGNASPSSLPVDVIRLAGEQPDLAIPALAVFPALPLAGTPVQLSALVSNLGAAAAPAAELSLLLLDGDGQLVATLAEGLQVPALAPGASATVTRTHTPPLAGPYTLLAAVDPLLVITEADENNNRAERVFLVGEDGLPALSVATDRSTYAAGDVVVGSIDVVNFGDVFDGRLVAAIVDAGGFEVAPLLDVAITNLPYAGTLHQAPEWSSAGIFAGPYSLRARLLDAAGAEVAAASADFTLLERLQLAARVETDRASYPPGAAVRATGFVELVEGNAALAGATARLRWLDAGGGVRFEHVQALGDLLPGDTASVTGTWTSTGAPVGTYLARFEVVRDEAVLISAEVPFLLAETPATGITGQLTLADASLPSGLPLQVQYSVTNGGAALTGVPIRVRLRQPGSLAVLATAERIADLPSGVPVAGGFSFPTGALGLGNWLATLEVEPAGAGVSTLDIAGFTTLDATPPVVSILFPLEGGFAPANPALSVSSLDSLSPVARVEASIDGGEWLAVAPYDLGNGIYRRSLALADGPHSARARAEDVWGNRAETPLRSFLVDTVPPVITVENVADGGVYDPGVAPLVSVFDLHPGTVETLLDGQPFVSGTAVTALGDHLLEVVAIDAAGNRADARVNFRVGVAAPLLAASKTAALAADRDGDGVPSPGDVLRYTLTVTNSGAAAASQVTVVDPIPAFTVLVPGSVTSTLGSVTASSPLTVEIGMLPIAAEAVVSFDVEVDAAVPAGVRSVSNQATITSGELPAVLSDDPALAGEADATVTTLNALPRLVAEKSDALAVDADGDGLASPGDTLEYSIAISNLGNTAATGVALADAVPADTALVEGSIVTSQGSVEAGPAVAVDLGELAAGAAASVRFRVTVASPLPAGVSEVVNQGTVTSTELAAVLTDDPALAGTADPTVTNVIAAPELVVTKTATLVADLDGNGFASPGDELLYLVTIANLGNTAALDVVLVDPQPLHTTLVPGSVQTSQGSVSGLSPLAVSFGNLLVGAEATVSWRVTIAADLPVEVSSISNQAMVSAQGVAAVPSDDPATPAQGDATVTPVRAELPPRFSVDDVTVTEGNLGVTPAVVTVSLSAPSSRTVTVDYGTADVSATAGPDYLAASGTLSFAPGETSKAVTLSVLADLVSEGTETFRLLLTNAVHATFDDAEAVITVLDDEGPPQLSIGDLSVVEGTGAPREVSLEVTLSTASASPVTVSYATVNGTALAPADYEAASGTLTFAAGERSASVLLRLVADSRDEADETFSVLLSAPAGATVADGEGVVTILDDDALPVLSIGDVSLVEGNTGSTAATLVVSLAPASGRAVDVAYSTIAGSATAGTDFTAASGSLHFAAGELTKTITVDVLGDTLAEPTESLLVRLAEPVFATLGDADGELRVLDDDQPVRFCPRSPGYWKTHPEAWPVRQLLIGAVVRTEPVLASYLDYGGADAATKLARQLVATKFNLLAGSDPVISPVVTQADAFLTTHPPGSNPQGAAKNQATSLKNQLELYNTQNCVLPVVSIADAEVTEGAAGASPVEALLRVTLSQASSDEVTLVVSTQDLSAVLDQDFSAPLTPFVIPPGIREATLRVPILGDEIVEGDETFQVVLEEAIGATLADGLALVTIHDDDLCASPNLLENGGAEDASPAGTPGWTAAAGEWRQRDGAHPPAVAGARLFAAEAAPQAVLVQTVDLGGFATPIDGGAQTLRVRGFVRTDGAFESGDAADLARLVVDYRNEAGGVLETFDSGDLAHEGGWLEVLDERTLPAGTRSARVRLIATRTTAEGALDAYFDELSLVVLGTPVLVVGDTAAGEPPLGQTATASFPLWLSCASPEEISVVAASRNGTAVAGDDYQALPPAVITLPPGSTSTVVPVTLLPDGLDEGEEDFFLDLTQPAGAVLLDPEGRARITEPVAGETCARSPGYWKTHPEAWPVSSLVLGGVSYDTAGLLALLDYGGPDAASKMARQLTAARLNLANGSAASIGHLVEAADALLAAFPPGSLPQGGDRLRAEQLQHDLEDYNHAACADGGSTP